MRRPILQQQAMEVERIRHTLGQETTITGSIAVHGVGEFMIDVDFPVAFFEQPIPLLGAPILQTEEEPQVEHFPFAEIGVARWRMRDVPRNSVHYVGARLAVRVAGRTGQRVIVPYMFVGRALTAVEVTD